MPPVSAKNTCALCLCASLAGERRDVMLYIFWHVRAHLYRESPCVWPLGQCVATYTFLVLMPYCSVVSSILSAARWRSRWLADSGRSAMGVRRWPLCEPSNNCVSSRTRRPTLLAAACARSWSRSIIIIEHTHTALIGYIQCNRVNTRHSCAPSRRRPQLCTTSPGSCRTGRAQDLPCFGMSGPSTFTPIVSWYPESLNDAETARIGGRASTTIPRATGTTPPIRCRR